DDRIAAGVLRLNTWEGQSGLDGAGNGSTVEEPLVVEWRGSLGGDGECGIAAQRHGEALGLGEDGEGPRNCTFTRDASGVDALNLRCRKGAAVEAEFIDCAEKPDAG